jgi:hypothetical protein
VTATSISEQKRGLVRDVRGDLHQISALTKEIACERASELLQIHNLIPHQHWELEDLLADGDQTRIYHAKSVVSQR